MRAVVVGLVVTLVAACGGRAQAAESRIEVVDAFTTNASTALAVYLDLDNPGGADRIVGAELVGESAGLADDVSLHQTAERDGLSIMEPTDAIEVDGGTDDALAPTGAHVMLEGLARPVAVDEVVEIRLDLDRGADLAVAVRVVSADEATGLLVGEGS